MLLAVPALLITVPAGQTVYAVHCVWLLVAVYVLAPQAVHVWFDEAVPAARILVPGEHAVYAVQAPITLSAAV